MAVESDLDRMRPEIFVWANDKLADSSRMGKNLKTFNFIVKWGDPGFVSE